ncbi:pectate lyase-like adhesive domain-containing protein [Lactobacillus johnsonii]|uniref:Adhesin n=1 Tax=Lactobacillus johnsonii N6.2 TaxID=1408186 RepID=A0A7D9N8P7_LACJH|nr:pectate lyase-like adhesive domain-containing protein [Lactobacillus johnsonii]AHA98127.1 hypothetical protein T285_01855 [Lactobacillus johnsonii N6.2]
MKDRKFKKNQETRNKYVDPNSLKESGDSSNPYLKELAALAAILGTGATGAAILPNDRVYAAQTSVDAKSQIVGSVSESTQTDLSNQGNSKSDENGVSTSNSEAKSMSTSRSKSLFISQSTSISLSQSISHSESTSRSTSLSNSQSLSESLSYSKSKLTSLSAAEKRTSTSHADSATSSSKNEEKSSVSNSSNSTNVGNFYSSENSSVTERQSTDQSNLNNTTSLSLRNTQLIDRNLKIPVALQTSINKNSTDNKDQLNKKQQLNELSLNGIFTNLVQTDTGVNVNNAQEFYNQVVNGTASVVNITNDIDLGASYGSQTGVMSTPHSVTINGNGHSINFGNFHINTNWLSSTDELTVTFNNVKLYTANYYGAVFLNNTQPVIHPNTKQRLVYNDVTQIGGVAAFADTGSSTRVTPSSKTLEISGNTTLTGVSSYTYNGTTYTPDWSTIAHGVNCQVYSAYNLIIDKGANAVFDAGNNALYNVALMGNNAQHNISIGDGAHVEMKGATSSNIFMPSYNGGDNVIDIGNDAFVTMNVKNTPTPGYPDIPSHNIDFNYQDASVNNTININPGAYVNLEGQANFISQGTVTVNITDPDAVFFTHYNNGEGYWGNSPVTYIVNARKTNIINQSGMDREVSPFVETNTATVNSNPNYTQSSVESTNTVLMPNQPGTVQDVANVNDQLVTKRYVTTAYTGYTAYSESTSTSTSVQTSQSISTVASESLSNAVSTSERLSNSVSMSDSLSNSVSMSDSLSKSVSMSESLSNSVSMSESLSNSVSMSESLSNSVSMSESLELELSKHE